MRIPTEYMLNNVVSILILYQLVRGGVELLEDSLRLLGSAVLEYALYDAASVRMGAQRIDLPGERADDELKSPRLHALDTLLDYVIAILILDAFQYVTVELANDFLLLLRPDGFQGFLNNPTAVHLQS